MTMGSVIAGCGYRFSAGGSFPPGIEKICISVMENRSGETGVENIVTDAIISELLRSAHIEITGEADADAFFSGVIDSIGIETISRSGARTATERRVGIVMRYTLTDREGHILRSLKEISDSESYPVASDKIATEEYRRRAIQRMVERTAERIYYHLAGIY